MYVKAILPSVKLRGAFFIFLLMIDFLLVFFLMDFNLLINFIIY